MASTKLKILSAQRVLLPFLAASLSGLLVAATLLGGGPEEVLGALPAILIALALVCGRYPGEAVIHRLAAPARQARRPQAPATIAPPRPRRAAASDRLAGLAGIRSLRGPPPLAIPTTR
jgi:hypothetical protein